MDVSGFLSQADLFGGVRLFFERVLERPWVALVELLMIGEGAWLQRWIHTSEDVVEPIVTAADRLSRKKIGALIAIERSSEAGAIIESGVPLEAVVTAEL